MDLKKTGKRIIKGIGITLLLLFLGCTGLIAYLLANEPVIPERAHKNYETSLDTSVRVQFKKIKTNGIELYTAVAGPEKGEPVILLHGFPDLWFGWESQLRALAARGYRVYAPDQRGYGQSDKPAGFESYAPNILVEDIIGLADSVGAKSFYLVGHDFGAAVGWNLAMRYPERLKKLVIINVPHPGIMLGYIQKHFSQLRKSWYAFFFLIPILPEYLIEMNDWSMIKEKMSSNFSAERLERYRKNWARPGAIRSMLHWYRASLRLAPVIAGTNRTIDVPTLIIWGKGDIHLEHPLASLSLEYCKQGRLVFFDDASHWPHQDEPNRTNKLLLEFF